MKSNRFILCAIATLCVATAHATTAPSLVGDTIDASMNFTAQSSYGAHRISGYGLDHPFVVASGTSDIKNFANIFTLDVDGNSFKIDFLRSGSFLNGTELKLTGLDFSSNAALKSISIASNLTGYSFNSFAHEIDIDLSNVCFTANSYLTGTFNVTSGTIAAVPEPSSFALAALGLAGLGAWTARRRASKPR